MTISVIGSGLSAVHFAWSAIDAGHSVRMIDFGRKAPDAPRATSVLRDLRRDHDDPAAYFLGDDGENIVYPRSEERRYRPPSDNHVFEGVPQQPIASDGFQALASFARGGLAQAWTGGVYPFNDSELTDFPFDHAELAQWYDEVARRIGVSGERDDLESFLPMHEHMLPALRLDESSQQLLTRYLSKRDQLARSFGARMGRSRTALHLDAEDRSALGNSGRGLWGCPSASLYTPEKTLDELLQRDGFEYVPGHFVTHFELDSAGRARRILTETADGGRESFEIDELVLAAGTLSSARILLESLRASGREEVRLRGLMDNRQLRIPFVNLSRIGRPWEEESYPHDQLELSLGADDPRELVHGRVTTLKNTMIHPLVQDVPLDLRTTLYAFKYLHGALGFLDVQFCDQRREENEVWLEREGDRSVLRVRYRPDAQEDGRVQRALRTYRKVLRKLGCLALPGAARRRPMGESGHASGLLPMIERDEPWTSTPTGELRGFENVRVVDGSTLPFLPAKGSAFTLMANAARIGARS